MRKIIFLGLVIVFSMLVGYSQPTNIDFSAGNLNGWTFVEGANVDSYAMTMTGITTSNQYSVMAPGSNEISSLPITMTSPLGGDFVRIGHITTGGYSYKLSQTFRVTSLNPDLAVSYALVLDDGGHTCDAQAYFNYLIKDSVGNIITNNHYVPFGSCSSGDPSFSTSNGHSYINWKNSLVSLQNYIGTNVNIEFIASGCVISQAAHPGYAYLDLALCSGGFSPNILSINTNTYSLDGLPNIISVCGTNSANIVAPLGATNYSWTGSGITGLTTQSVSVSQPGIYYLVFDKPTGCLNTTSVTIKVGNSPTLAITGPTTGISCGYTGINLSATGAYSYAWAPFALTSSGNFSAINKVYPGITTIYTVTGTDTMGCTGTAQYTVTVASSPSLSITGSTLICPGNSALLTVSGADTYSWSTGVTTTSVVLSPTVNTNYNVKGFITSTGCSQTLNFSVKMDGVLSYSPGLFQICLGDSLNINALGATNYTWSTGATTNTINVKPTINTSYTVDATSACGVRQGVVTVTVNPLPNVPITQITPVVCGGVSANFATTSGFQSYTWSTGSTTYNTSFTSSLSPISYTNTISVRALTSAGCTNTSSTVYTVFPVPTISTSISNDICTSNTATLSATGADNYTWTPGNMIGSDVIISPSVTTTYSVVGAHINGCSNKTVVTVGISTSTITSAMATPSIICAYNSSTLTALGNGIFNWYDSDTTSQYIATGSSFVTPSLTAGTYTYYSSSTCSGLTRIPLIVTVKPVPIINIVTTSTMVCNNTPFELIPSGASTYTCYSPYVINDTIPIVQTNSSKTYWIGGTASNGCVGYGSININLYPISNISILPLLPYREMCKESSITFSLTGAPTYTWSNGIVDLPATFTPSISTSYTVGSTDFYGCYAQQTFSINVHNTCADVWPGDTNSDGIADNLDVLELGLHYSQTGASRISTSNNWQPYGASNWVGTITNGSNLNHSDCNGDGIINDNDTLAIFYNYGLTHILKSLQTTTVNPQLSIVPDQSMVVKGTWGTASVYLGDVSNVVNNINGVAFTVDFNNTLIEPNSIWIEYPNSFIDVGQNLHFRKLDFANSKLFTASTHTVSSNVNGFGKIATLHYKILSSLATDEVLNIGVSQAYRSDATGLITPLTSGTGTLMAIGASVGIMENLYSGNVLVSPNPTNGLLNISFNSIPQNTKIELYNSIGALVLTEVMSNKNNTINASELSNGIYFLKVIEANKLVAAKKVVKE